MGGQAICIDFDGVIADTCAAKKAWLSENVDVAVPETISRSALVPLIGSSMYHMMQASVGFEDTLEARPLPYAKSTMRTLAGQFALYVLTARGEHKVRWVRRWLELHELSGLIVDTISCVSVCKLEVASRLRATWLIDNDPRHLSDLGYNTKRILFGGAANMICGVEMARSWRCVELIVNRKS